MIITHKNIKKKGEHVHMIKEIALTIHLEMSPKEVVSINTLRRKIEHQLGIDVSFNSVCGMAIAEGLKALENTYQSELPFSD